MGHGDASAAPARQDKGYATIAAILRRMLRDEFEASPEPPRPRLTVLAIVLLAGAVLGAVAGGGAGYLAGQRASDGRGVPSATATSGPAVVNQLRVEQSSAFSDAVEKVLPSMVVLEVEGPARRDSFGRLVQSTSAGSGVIVDSAGYVVTNAHVVEQAQLINVFLADGRQLPAVVLDDDLPYTDVAILKIQEGSLVAAEMGDSDALKLGDLVAAIGTPVASTALPRAFENSVTMGVISGLHRRWDRNGTIQEDLIQTDSALNHGNSGGALVNLQGQVVGITSTVIRQAETGDTVEGLGFAVASNTVRALLSQVMATGAIERPDLGVVTVDVTPELAASNNLSVDHGAYVQEVLPASPADGAGIRQGDIIAGIGGESVTLDHPLSNLLKAYHPGDQVVVAVIRGGQALTFDVVLGTR